MDRLDLIFKVHYETTCLHSKQRDGLLGVWEDFIYVLGKLNLIKLDSKSG